jgi:PAS domain S-box-containing protein
MDRPVRILHFDDSYFDGGLVETELERRQTHASVRFVRTKAEFLDAIARQEFDVILSDFGIPEFDGIEALRRARSLYPDIPFILLIDTSEEERALAMLREGVTDYVLKAQLRRLIPAIERAVDDARRKGEQRAVEPKLRRSLDELQRLQNDLVENKRIQEELRSAAEKYRRVFESMTEAAAIVEPVFHDRDLRADYIFVDMNSAFELLTGAERKEHLGKPASQLFGELPRLDFLSRVALTGQSASFETFIPALGKHIVIAAFPADAGRVLALFTDITERKQMEEALLRYQHRLSLVQEAGQIGVFDWNITGGQVAWTAELACMYGAPKQEQWHTYEEWSRLIHPNDRPRVERTLRDWLVSSRNEEQMEYQIIRPDGRARWMEMRARLVRNSEGRPVRMIGTNLDITGRKEMEEMLRDSKEQLHRAVSETSTWGIWACDADGRNIYVSPSFLAFVGMTLEECSDFGWANALHPDEADATLAAWKDNVHAGAFWERIHRFRGADGTYHQVLARGVPVREDDGAVVCWVGVNLDVDQMMERPPAEPPRAQEDLEPLRALFSRDMKSPMSVLSSLVRLLSAGNRDLLNEKQRRCLQMIQENVGQMNDLVTGLLTISRIRRQPQHMMRVETRTLVEGVVERERKAAGFKRGVSIRVGDLPACTADPVMLQQVFAQLVANAIRFTSKVPEPRIEIGCFDEPEAVVFYVRDNGAGFSEGQETKLFRAFHRLHEQSESEGLGVGLASVRTIIERHGGRVWAKGEKGKGATFYFTLPRHPAIPKGTSRSSTII